MIRKIRRLKCCQFNELTGPEMIDQELLNVIFVIERFRKENDLRTKAKTEKQDICEFQLKT